MHGVSSGSHHRQVWGEVLGSWFHSIQKVWALGARLLFLKDRTFRKSKTALPTSLDRRFREGSDRVYEQHMNIYEVKLLSVKTQSQGPIAAPIVGIGGHRGKSQCFQEIFPRVEGRRLPAQANGNHRDLGEGNRSPNLSIGPEISVQKTEHQERPRSPSRFRGVSTIFEGEMLTYISLPHLHKKFTYTHH